MTHKFHISIAVIMMFAALLISTVVLFVQLKQRQTYTSKASESDNPSVTVSLKSGDCTTSLTIFSCPIKANPGDTITFAVTASSTAQISALDFFFTYNKARINSIAFTSVDVVTKDAENAPLYVPAIAEEKPFNDEKLLRIALYADRATEKLSNTVIFTLSFRVLSADPTNIAFVSAPSSAVGPITNYRFAILPQNTLGTDTYVLKNIPHVAINALPTPSGGVGNDISNSSAWSSVQPFGGIYPWSNGGPTSGWDKPISKGIVVCNKNICWNYDAASSTWLNGGAGGDISTSSWWSDVQPKDGIYPWSNGGPTSAWTSPQTNYTNVCNGSICWTRDQNEPPHWLYNGVGNDISNSSAWSSVQPFGGIYPWSNGGPTSAWNNPILKRISVCNKNICWNYDAANSTWLNGGAGGDISTSSWWSAIQPFGDVYPWSNGGPTSAWTNPQTNQANVCNGSICWTYDYNTSQWLSGGGSIQLAITTRFNPFGSTVPDACKTIQTKIKLVSQTTHTTIALTNVPFTAQANGTFTASARFNGVLPALDYQILIKGPKHIQKRFCELNPQIPSSGRYNCGAGTIRVDAATTALNADFSAVPVLLGDIPEQNGIADMRDLILVKSLFHKTGTTDLTTADINCDGAINGADYSLLLGELQKGYADEN